MTESNFEGMTRQELLAYIRQHPQDTKAFHLYSAAKPVFTSVGKNFLLTN